MSYMFIGCISLKKLNLSNFNNKKMTNIECMFYNCISLEELNISNFNIKNTTKARAVFDACHSLKQKDKIDIENLK